MVKYILDIYFNMEMCDLVLDASLFYFIYFCDRQEQSREHKWILMLAAWGLRMSDIKGQIVPWLLFFHHNRHYTNKHSSHWVFKATFYLATILHLTTIILQKHTTAASSVTLQGFPHNLTGISAQLIYTLTEHHTILAKPKPINLNHQIMASPTASASS